MLLRSCLFRFATLTHYELLRVGRTATHHDIKVAYRKLAKKHHPDIGKTKDSEELFKLINLAYETLKDDNKRRLYDLSLSNVSFSETGHETEQSQRSAFKQDFYDNRWHENRKPGYSNLRDDYYHYSMYEEKASDRWTDRMAKVSIVILAYFAYKALATSFNKDGKMIERNKQVIQASVHPSELYIDKVPLTHYIKHRSNLNKAE